MRAIQFRRNVSGQATASQGLSCVFSVGRSGKKIPAQRKKYFRLSVMHRLNRMHCVQSRLTWRLEIEFGGELIKELFGGPLPNAHGSVALHVAVATNGTE